MSAERTPHTGHLDAELDRPEALTNERLVAIALECLQRWDGFPAIPGSRRWSVNGKTALRELERRRNSLEEQLEAAQARIAYLEQSWHDSASMATYTSKVSDPASRRD